MSDTPQDPRIAVLEGLLNAFPGSQGTYPEECVRWLAALNAVDPARVWRPIAEAPRTRAAAPKEPVCRSTCSRMARLVMPFGKRAVSCAAMMRATPGVRRRSR